MHKRAVGKIGELKACEVLAEAGYTVIEQNYFSRYGEIDIIAMQEDLLVFVEVKYRRNSKFGHAVESITDKKKQCLMQTAMCYIQEKKRHNASIRFDLIAIDSSEVTWIKQFIQGG